MNKFFSLSTYGFKYALIAFALAAIAVLLRSPMLFGFILLTSSGILALKIMTGIGFVFGALMRFMEIRIESRTKETVESASGEATPVS